MQVLIIVVVVLLESFYMGNVQAASPDQCYWVHTGNNDHQTTIVRTPATIKLRMVEVGRSMGVYKNNMVEIAWQPLLSGVACPYPGVAQMNISYAVMPSSVMKPDPGYRDVYKTGVQGIGVRISNSSMSGIERVMPLTHTYQNRSSFFLPVISPFDYEFIRTDTVVGTGRMTLNYQVAFKVNEWHALTISSQVSPINVVLQSFFTGCTGIQKEIKVPMGDVRAGQVMLGNTRAEAFDMDVRCVGLPAGSKLPVKAYFEGDSPGTGRLNLLKGGAKGVEISLLGGSGTGTALPFSKAQAINMTWLKTDPEGEVYTLPIKARFVQKPNTSVVPGKADAVLNYILEYD